MSNANTETRGRPAFTADKNNIVTALRSFQNESSNDNRPSYYLTRQLAARGFLEVVTTKQEGRGRPANSYVLTGKGKTYINFSRNWR